MTYSRDDFETAAPPRIMGSESEYTTDAIAYDRGLQRYTGDIAAYHMKSLDNGEELWLENGARFYLDCGGAMLEYATPETTSAHDVAKYEIAGERTVQAYAERAAAAMRAQGDNVSSKAYKRSGYDAIKHSGRLVLQRMTAGHHENYLTSANIGAQYSRRRIGSFLCSRAVWAGAGLITQDGFELSQKTSAIDFHSDKKTSDFGTKSPYRMEVSQEPLRRLEVRVGDGNMVPAAIIRKYAVTSFVLRMIEHGAFPEGLTIPESDQSESFRRTAQLKTIRVGNGNVMSAAEHQRAILLIGLEYFSGRNSVTLPDEEMSAANETIGICSVINDMTHYRDSEQLVDDVDWAAKLQVLRDNGIHRPSGEDLAAVMLDIRYEDISVKGLSRQRELLKQDTTQFSEASIRSAQVLPPTTRAQKRTDILRDLPTHPALIHWDSIKHDGVTYLMADPYMAV